MIRKAQLLRYTCVALVAAFIFAIAFRGPLFRMVITYRIVNVRHAPASMSRKFYQNIDSLADHLDKPSADQIIKTAVSVTAQSLSYKASPGNNNPNFAFRYGRANCVGYALLFSSTCNYLFTKFGYHDEWKATPVVGQLYVGNINVHSYLSDPLFSDHDFSIVTNSTTQIAIGIDPTVHDYFDISSVSLVTHE
jgi:hypothetical protein